jgi:hypothetical protein
MDPNLVVRKLHSVPIGTVSTHIRLRRLTRERDVAHPPTLCVPDHQRLDVTVIIGDLEAAEFAVPAASQQRRMDEIAEGVALAGFEQVRDLLVGKIADDWGVNEPEGLHAAPSIVGVTRPARQA